MYSHSWTFLSFPFPLHCRFYNFSGTLLVLLEFGNLASSFLWYLKSVERKRRICKGSQVFLKTLQMRLSEASIQFLGGSLTQMFWKGFRPNYWASLSQVLSRLNEVLFEGFNKLEGKGEGRERGKTSWDKRWIDCHFTRQCSTWVVPTNIQIYKYTNIKIYKFRNIQIYTQTNIC